MTWWWTTGCTTSEPTSTPCSLGCATSAAERLGCHRRHLQLPAPNVRGSGSATALGRCEPLSYFLCVQQAWRTQDVRGARPPPCACVVMALNDCRVRAGGARGVGERRSGSVGGTGALDSLDRGLGGTVRVKLRDCESMACALWPTCGARACLHVRKRPRAPGATARSDRVGIRVL